MRPFTQLVIGLAAIIIMLSCAPKQEKNVQTSTEDSEISTDPTSQILDSTVSEVKTDSNSIEDNTSSKDVAPKNTVAVFKYDLSSPAETFILDRSLIEISGLSFDDKKNLIYAVNDERGNLYSLNPEDGKIVDRKKFGKRGDYEGVEVLNNGLIYAVKSNGNLVEIDLPDEDYNSIKTDLHTSNDVEGLGYIPDENILLLACKGSPSIARDAKRTKKKKAIYSWSINEAALSEEPYMEITDDALIKILDSQMPDLTKSKRKKYKKRLTGFSPSAIAYNEKDGLLYILSSVGKLLIIVDKSSAIQHIEFLDNTYFVQPEGICFDQDDNLYISNEGKGLVAKLMKFEHQ